MDGYRKMFNDTLVTVWSAPNYCYRCGNVAAILELDENLNPNYKRFEAATNETRGVPAKKPAPEYFLWFINIFIQFYKISNQWGFGVLGFWG